MRRSRAARFFSRVSALHFMLYSLNEPWQGLKWEKVEAAEVAAVEHLFLPWRAGGRSAVALSESQSSHHGGQ